MGMMAFRILKILVEWQLSVATPTAIIIVAGTVEASAIKTAGNKFGGIHEVLLWGALLMSKVCLMSSYRTLTAPDLSRDVLSFLASVIALTIL
jgi:hypothetical protein